ncbi:MULTISPECIES: hypothetical protein [Moorena]|uniref:Serine kinase of the HPr protein, regulates carbohydrate metabolism n=1 Tax=Moorena producens 3L TaxID=489825 RepID=F4XU93_9CYAN|nr:MULTISPECIES: hypothetical protein [Moorena]EGJ32069.1 hypothetical protein LYNGBM3L_30730 [Moorena producens 3L]NEP33745.1 hypothetical protein [Moorena sp. SIO3B2]NEP64218.1 hypothetical protein [Moorena sp. SIO3A5]NEQ07586.1 hypothetical protein [Moorena sp. SIO4E2]NER88102.1 hypothetical protein [Moorena sp. SIO3A2]
MSKCSVGDISEIDSQSVDCKALGGNKQKLFSYVAYGLGIHSALPIPEFIPAEVECDVTIHIQSNDYSTGCVRVASAEAVGHATRSPNRKISDYIPKEVIQQPMAFQLSRDEAVIYLKDTGLFLVQGGNTIIIIPAAGACLSRIQTALVGTVMAILLYQRGLLVLHASVVNINGGAVVFLGNSGEGKSSIAAALHTQGYRIITDDVAPVRLDQGKAKVAPSFPQIKLSREVAKVLGYDQDKLGLLVPKLNKPGYLLNQDFTQALLPIRCIYVLVSGSQLSIKRLKLQEAVMELSHHSRLNSLFDSEKASHLLQCAQLANQCSVYRLQRPRNLALLPELGRLVAEHQFIQGKM